MATLKELSMKEIKFTGGTRTCAGCAAPIIVKQVLLAAPHNPVIINATGCLYITTAIIPYSSWRTPYYHSAFENAAAVASGVEGAVRALKRKGMLGDRTYDVIAIGGDGGTYDIGLQAISGMLERGHRCLYICYDNGAYMNTGIQRSGSTPFGAWTTTSHVGEAQKGKPQHQKDMIQIAAAHGAYAASASPHRWRDLMQKVEKALNYEGPSFINIQSPCPRGWRYPASETIKIARLATETCIFPLYEVEEKGEKWTVNYIPKNKLPVAEYLKPQGRFEHFFRPGNEHLLEELQAETDRRWNRLLRLAGIA
ncbi:MAG: pyruvate ferredoxin oxidoreductase [Firmicutes bacterium]|nr:pyruvate ferredoxin oxidoreductase [Bacillota bacterium]